MHYDATAWTGRTADICLAARASRRLVGLIYVRMPYDAKCYERFPCWGFEIGYDLYTNSTGLRLYWRYAVIYLFTQKGR